MDVRLDGRGNKLLRSLATPSRPLAGFNGDLGIGNRLLRRPLAMALAGRVTIVGRAGVRCSASLLDVASFFFVSTLPIRGRPAGASPTCVVDARLFRRGWPGGRTSPIAEARPAGATDTRLVP